MLVHRWKVPGIDLGVDFPLRRQPLVAPEPGRSRGSLPVVQLEFRAGSAAFRRIAKVYVWMELNHDHDLASVCRSVTGRGAVYTLHYRMPHLRSLLSIG